MSSSFRDPCQRNSWKETVVGCAASRQWTRNQNSTKYPMLSPNTHWEYRKDSTQGNPKAQNPKSEPGSESWYLDSGKVDEKLETRILGYRVPGYGVPVLLENTRWYKDVLDVNLGLSCLSARGWYTKANCYGYVLIDWAEGQTGKYLAQGQETRGPRALRTMTKYFPVWHSDTVNKLNIIDKSSLMSCVINDKKFLLHWVEMLNLLLFFNWDNNQV